MDFGIFNVRTDVNVCDFTRGCTETVRESALKVDSGRKIPCRTRESNLRRRRASPMLYQLSYIPTHPFNIISAIIISDSHDHLPNGGLTSESMSYEQWQLININEMSRYSIVVPM